MGDSRVEINLRNSHSRHGCIRRLEYRRRRQPIALSGREGKGVEIGSYPAG